MEVPGYIAAGLAASYLLFRERHRLISALKRLSKQPHRESLTQDQSTGRQLDERNLPATCFKHDRLAVLGKWRRRLGAHISSEDDWEVAA